VRQKALFGVAQVFVFQVYLVSLLDDFPEGFLVLLPQVLITLFFTEEGVDELLIGALEVHLCPLSLL
jgi:hypothetical protein